MVARQFPPSKTEAGADELLKSIQHKHARYWDHRTAGSGKALVMPLSGNFN
jgi:hypothetical protein